MHLLAQMCCPKLIDKSVANVLTLLFRLLIRDFLFPDTVDSRLSGLVGKYIFLDNINPG